MTGVCHDNRFYFVGYEEENFVYLFRKYMSLPECRGYYEVSGEGTGAGGSVLY